MEPTSVEILQTATSAVSSRAEELSDISGAVDYVGPDIFGEQLNFTEIQENVQHMTPEEIEAVTNEQSNSMLDSILGMFTPPPAPAAPPPPPPRSPLAGFFADTFLGPSNPELGSSLETHIQRELVVPNEAANIATGQTLRGWLGAVFDQRFPNYNPENMPNLAFEEFPSGLQVPGHIPGPQIPTVPQPDVREFERQWQDVSIQGENQLFGSPGSDLLGGGLSIVNASFVNQDQPADGVTFSTDSGGAFVAVPNEPPRSVESILGELTRVTQTGGNLTPHQRALVQTMTPEQRRVAGIFLTPSGEVVPTTQVLLRALNNIANGIPLNANQMAALGAVFNNISDSGDRRDVITQLAQTTGIPRDDISAAVGPSMRALIEDQRVGIRQAEDRIAESNERAIRLIRKQVVKTLGKDRTFVTENGRRVDIETVVARALRNLSEGKPLSANQRAVLAEYRRETGSTLGRRETAFRTPSGEIRTREKVLANALSRLRSGRRLTANQVLALRQEGIRVTAAGVPTQPLYMTARGGIRTQAQVLARAMERQAAGRFLTANQRQAIRRAERAGEPIYTTAEGETRTQAQVLARAQQRQAAGQYLTANQRLALRRAEKAGTPTYTTARGDVRTQAQVLARAQERQAAGQYLTANQRLAMSRAAPTYTTARGETRTQTQVLTRARERQAAGQFLTANQRLAVSRAAAARPAAPPPRRAAPTYVTSRGEVRTQAQVVARAQERQAAGQFLTANQRLAMSSSGGGSAGTGAAASARRPHIRHIPRRRSNSGSGGCSSSGAAGCRAVPYREPEARAQPHRSRSQVTSCCSRTAACSCASVCTSACTSAGRTCTSTGASPGAAAGRTCTSTGRRPSTSASTSRTSTAPGASISRTRTALGASTTCTSAPVRRTGVRYGAG